MAGETINVDAVDRVLAETPAAPVDEVRIPAAEAVRLRTRAALADQLERSAAHTLTQAAITEATAAIPFVDDVAAAHARTLLRERVIVKPDEHGSLTAYDRETGRPAAAALRELATGPEYSRYIRAPHQGGGGGGNTPPSNAPKDDVQARREAMARRMTTRVSEGGSPGIGGFGGRTSF